MLLYDDFVKAIVNIDSRNKRRRGNNKEFYEEIVDSFEAFVKKY